MASMISTSSSPIRFNRKMSESEMKRMVGSKIHNEYYPERYYCHDAEDPEGWCGLAKRITVNRSTSTAEPLNLIW